MKEEGRSSKAPLAEAFGNWTYGRIVLLALLGLTAGQAVVWYTGQFYALFFLTQTLKVDAYWAQIMIALSLVIGTPFFVVFGWLSDKIGRKPIIMLGCLLAVFTYYPEGILKHIPGASQYAYPGIFELLTRSANPELAAAIDRTPVTVTANPDECRLQFDPVGKSKFTAPCDVAKAALVKAGVPYGNEAGARRLRPDQDREPRHPILRRGRPRCGGASCPLQQGAWRCLEGGRLPLQVENRWRKLEPWLAC